MNRKLILAIWKKLLVWYVLPWLVYTLFLLIGYFPLWTGLFLPFLVFFAYSRYTYSSFTIPKYTLLVLYMFSLYVGLTKYILDNDIISIKLPITLLISLIFIIILGYRGIRSWVSYMGTSERALGASTYFLSLLYGIWVYLLVNFKVITMSMLLWIFVAYSVFSYGIYLLQLSGKAFQLKLANLSFRPGTYLGTIGNPLTFNLNLLLASFLGTLGLYELTSSILIAWLYSLVTMLFVLYNTKRSIVIGFLVYLILFPLMLLKDLHLSLWFAGIYYLLLVIGIYFIVAVDMPITRRIRSNIFGPLYAWKLKNNVHPQIKYFLISTATTRLWLTISGIKTWLKSPLWGFGFEYVRRYLMENRAIETYYAEHLKGYDRSHNMYVDMLIEGGILWFIIVALINTPVVFNLYLTSPAAFLLYIVIAAVLIFLFWDIVFLIGYGYIIGWSYYLIEYIYLVKVSFWMLLGVDIVLIMLVLLTLFRHLADMYKGYSRTLMIKDLEAAREEASISVKLFPYQDHNVVWFVETTVKLIQLLEARQVSPAYAGKLANDVIQFEEHVKVTNYPDTFLAYLGYAYGILYRLGCQECLDKAIFFFEQAMSINPFNEFTITSYANFLGNIGKWRETCKILETLIFTKYTDEPLTFLEQMKDVFKKYYQDQLQYVYRKNIDETFDTEKYLQGHISWQPGRISSNILKMYIYCLIETGRTQEAKNWLEFFEKLYKDADLAFIDEMFLKIKLSQLRNL